MPHIIKLSNAENFVLHQLTHYFPTKSHVILAASLTYSKAEEQNRYIPFQPHKNRIPGLSGDTLIDMHGYLALYYYQVYPQVIKKPVVVPTRTGFDYTFNNLSERISSRELQLLAHRFGIPQEMSRSRIATCLTEKMGRRLYIPPADHYDRLLTLLPDPDIVIAYDGCGRLETAYKLIPNIVDTFLNLVGQIGDERDKELLRLSLKDPRRRHFSKKS